MILLGVIGNGLVIYVYGVKLDRSGDNTYMLALAVADMIMVSIGVPFELLHSRFTMYIAQVEPVSKLIRYIEASAFAFGGSLTSLIALDRYYTVTKPSSHYGAKSRTRAYIIGTFVFTVVTTSPCLVMYGAKDVKTAVSGVVGKDCTIPDNINGSLFLLVNIVFVFAIFTVGSTITAVLYIRIGIGIWRWKKGVVGEYVPDQTHRKRQRVTKKP
jgi:hypothetical protein